MVVDLSECRSCDVGKECRDRKSTRLNSSHQIISYAVFCLKKKKAERWEIKVKLPATTTAGFTHNAHKHYVLGDSTSDSTRHLAQRVEPQLFMQALTAATDD